MARKRKGPKGNVVKAKAEQRVAGFKGLGQALKGPNRAEGASRPGGSTAPSKPKVERTKAPEEKPRNVRPLSKMPRSLGGQGLPRTAPPRQGALRREDPAAWVLDPRFLAADGRCPKSLDEARFADGETREQRELVIGLDFGTSSTKVAIRDLSLGRSRVCSFGDYGHPSAPCLLPTSICLSKAGKFAFGGGFELTSLKDRFMFDPHHPIAIEDTGIQTTPLALCVGYLAYALRVAVDGYLKDRAQELAALQLVWTMNVGLPSRDHSDEELTDAYKLLSLAAWIAALGKEDLFLEDVEAAIAEARSEIAAAKRDATHAPANPAVIQPDEIEVVPEVVAETTGYCASDRARENQIHVLIDIGATTVDLCVFLLDKKRHRLMQVTDVVPLGLQQLHHRKLDESRNGLSRHLHDLSRRLEPDGEPPKDGDYLPSDVSGIQSVWARFSDDFVEAFRRVIVTARKHQRDSRRWSGGVPLLLYGGGSKYRPFRKTIDDLRESANARTFGVREGYELMRHAKPEDLFFPRDCRSEFIRFAVAYGLSFPRGGSDKFLPEAPIPPDLEPVVPHHPGSAGHRGVYIDKDMV